MLPPEGAKGVASHDEVEEIVRPVRPFPERHKQWHRTVFCEHAIGQLQERRRLARASRRDDRQRLAKCRKSGDPTECRVESGASFQP
jgi:hypothetical protein